MLIFTQHQAGKLHLFWYTSIEMNVRRFGKLLVFLGFILACLYIIWVVFRVIKKPEDVERDGLLPNPFEIIKVLPRPGELNTNNTPQENPADLPEELITELPEKKLVRISSLAARDIILLHTKESEEYTDAVTEKVNTIAKDIPVVRYASYMSGTIHDIKIKDDQIKEKRIFSSPIQGLESIEVGRYLATGMYSTPGGVRSGFVIELDSSFKDKNSKSESLVKEKKCSLDLVAVDADSSGYPVEIMQDFLRREMGSFIYTPGSFDGATKDQLKSFQQLQKIPTTGAFDKKTLEVAIKLCSEKYPISENDEYVDSNPVEDTKKVTPLPRSTLESFLVDDTKLFTFANVKARNRGYIRDLKTGNEDEVYSLMFYDWIPFMYNESVLLQSRAAGSIPGYVFILNPITKNLSPLIKDKLGLSIAPQPALKKIIYSYIESDILKTVLYDVDTRSEKELPFRTFSEKCTSGDTPDTLFCAVPEELPDAYIYPDEWYKRGVRVKDRLYKYTISTNTFTELSVSDEVLREGLDILDLQFDATTKVLFFRDNTYGFVWRVKTS